jgi:hypothetical protein
VCRSTASTSRRKTPASRPASRMRAMRSIDRADAVAIPPRVRPRSWASTCAGLAPTLIASAGAGRRTRNERELVLRAGISWRGRTRWGVLLAREPRGSTGYPFRGGRRVLAPGGVPVKAREPLGMDEDRSSAERQGRFRVAPAFVSSGLASALRFAPQGQQPRVASVHRARRQPRAHLRWGTNTACLQLVQRMARPGLEPGTPRFSVSRTPISNSSKRPASPRVPANSARSLAVR